jgi:hypothetical protein
LAIALWVLALFLPAFGLYGGKTMSGLEVLLTGWLGPLGGAVSWYANPFFLFGVTRLFAGAMPIMSALSAALLAVPTLFLRQFLADEAGGLNYVYGLGWGAVAWFAAIGFLLLGTGLSMFSPSAAARRIPPLRQPLAAGIGSVWLCGLAIGVLWLGVSDRMGANAQERAALRNVAFKFGQVCRVEQPPILGTIRAARIEVVTDTELSDARLLLASGANIVRSRGWDHQLSSDGSTLFRFRSDVAPDVRVEYFAGNEEAKVRVTSVVDGRVLVDGSWRRIHKRTGETCPPAAIPWPRETAPPMSLVLATVGLPDKARPSGPRLDKPDSLPVRELSGVDVDFRAWNPRLEPTPVVPLRQRVVGCPSNVEWTPAPFVPSGTKPYGPWLRIDGREYLVEGWAGVVCRKSSLVLIGTKYVWRGAPYLVVDTRGLDDLSVLSRVRVPLSPDLARGEMTALSLEDDGLTLKMEWHSGAEERQVRRVRAALRLD